MYHCHLLHHEDEGMMGSFLVIDTSLTGISEIDLSSTIKVFPNPTSGKINIFTLKHKITSISVLNMMGETILNNSFRPVIDLSAAPNGIYFIEVKTEQGIVSKKIVLLK